MNTPLVMDKLGKRDVSRYYHIELNFKSLI